MPSFSYKLVLLTIAAASSLVNAQTLSDLPSCAVGSISFLNATYESRYPSDQLNTLLTRYAGDSCSLCYRFHRLRYHRHQMHLLVHQLHRNYHAYYRG